MTTQSTIITSSISTQVPENHWQKKAMLSVAFLMATTSVGPGFLTQTAVFTNIYKVDMAFPVLASIFITFGIVMNLWRIVGVSGLRIQDIANKVAPGMGYGVGVLLALGAVAFNFGNVSGAALGINVLTGVDTTWGALFTGLIGCLLFVVHNASKRMDQMARYLGLFMIVLIAYVAMTSLPPMGETLSAAVMPTDIGSLLLPTLTFATAYTNYCWWCCWRLLHRCSTFGRYWLEGQRKCTVYYINGVGGHFYRSGYPNSAIFGGVWCYRNRCNIRHGEPRC